MRHQAIVSLIASTTIRTGLIVRAALDRKHNETAVKVPDAGLARLRIKPHTFHANGTTQSHRDRE